MSPAADPLQEALGRVLDGERLSAEMARGAFETIMDGSASPARLGAFLAALRVRGETVTEIAAFARVMRERAAPMRVDRWPLLDTCGTGGDGSGTFNISTITAIVVAASGVAVAKHGNHGVSSRCGSADLLLALGVRVDAPLETVERTLREVGLGFLFAPSLHGAMRHAAAVRRELGARTVFNLLGPLTNPAGARRQLLGVYDPARLEGLAQVLRELGSERAMVVHGDGLDEVALHGATRVAELRDGQVRTYTLTPEDAGLRRAPLEAIMGGDVGRNVAIARAILEGETGPARDIVLLNSAAALRVAGEAEDLRDGAARAARAIDSGAAKRVLQELRDRAPAGETTE